jgi:hypothetical protein
MGVKIEKGVRLPENAPRGPNSHYPLVHMKVGDSFLVPLLDEVKVRSAVSHHARRYGRTFRVLKMANGIRVWRVKADA